MLFATPELDAEDQRVLGEIEAMRDKFRFRLAEPKRWEGQLRRSLTAAAVRSSTHIEGYTISPDDAETLLAGGELPADIAPDTRDAVLGYQEALTYVQHAAHFHRFAWDHSLLSALHFMMTRTNKRARPGDYRNAGVWVTGGRGEPPTYTAPDPNLVPELMDEFVASIQQADTSVPGLVRASMAHLNLVSIHPWRDGNGRMSRAVHTLVLARESILAPEFSSIEEWLGAGAYNTMEYYAALRSVQNRVFQPERSAHSWLRFCLRTHHLQAQTVERRFEVAARVWFRAEELAKEHNLNERTVSALYAAAYGHLRRTPYQEEEGLTRDQAVSDLRLLRQLGLIEAVGHARTQHYIAGAALMQSRAEIDADVHASFYREPY
jgi:Fic family protein